MTLLVAAGVRAGAVDPFARDLRLWHDFFLATAVASSVLAGLVFVGLSLSERSVRVTSLGVFTLGTQSTVSFVYAVVASSVMLMPELGIWVPGVALAGLAALAVVDSVSIVGEQIRSSGVRRRGRDVVLRLVMPALVSVLLVTAAVTTLARLSAGPYVLGFATLVAMAFGIRSAYEILVTRADRADRTQRPGPRPGPRAGSESRPESRPQSGPESRPPGDRRS